jgi:hypothetical protein
MISQRIKSRCISEQDAFTIAEAAPLTRLILGATS